MNDNDFDVAVSAFERPRKSDLLTTKPEELEVVCKPTSPPSRIGTTEFAQQLYELLSGKEIWRSSKSLAEHMGVDSVDLHRFLSAQPVVCTRPGKDEGVFYYALMKRLELPNKKEKIPSRPLVNEDDRYAIAMLHASYRLLHAALSKWAINIAERNEEAFTKVLRAKENLEGGIVLYAQRCQIDLDHLPKV